MVKQAAAGGRRPTIRDVAAAAGVSYATVSRVINGGHWVSPAARAAVAAAITSTGYTANTHARSLVTGRTNSIAFLLTEEYQMLFADPTFALLLRGMAEAATRRSMTLVLLVAGTDEERDSVQRFVDARHVDGVMLISTHEQEPLLDSLLATRIPTIACGLPLRHQDHISSVSVDEVTSARTMTRHLLDAGHRRIAMVAGPPDTPGGRFRLEGFRDEMGDAFDASLVAEGDYSITSGTKAMAELLATGARFDAVFAANDRMAMGAIAALRRAGYSVPGDVAVAGFDDSGGAATHDPPLTTMRQPWEQLSEEMVALLLETIGGAGVRHVQLPTELVVRASA